MRYYGLLGRVSHHGGPIQRCEPLRIKQISGTAAAQTHFAVLDGAQEVPPIVTATTGTGTFTLAGNTLSYTFTWSGLSGTPTGFHIHGPAIPGTNAPILLDLSPGGTPVSPLIGSTGFGGGLKKADLNNGLWYANLHTAANPTGEIRGQILTTVATHSKTWGAIKALYEAR